MFGNILSNLFVHKLEMQNLLVLYWLADLSLLRLSLQAVKIKQIISFHTSFYFQKKTKAVGTDEVELLDKNSLNYLTLSLEIKLRK